MKRNFILFLVIPSLIPGMLSAGVALGSAQGFQEPFLLRPEAPSAGCASRSLRSGSGTRKMFCS